MSVIMPMHRLSPARMQNAEIHRKAMRKAKNALKRQRFTAEITELLLNNLDGLNKKFKPEHAMDGLGLFVSPKVVELVHFPFPVMEKVIIDKTFETRDLHYLNQLLTPYYLLTIGKKRISLYAAKGDDLSEIKDGHFPMEYEEEYEYARPSRGASYGNALKGFEKDKSVMENIRTLAFFRKATQHLAQYINKPDVPLLVAGTRTQLAGFTHTSGLSDHIAGTVTGSFSHKNFENLHHKAWMGIISFMQRQIKERIREIAGKGKPGKLAKGIQEVWQAAYEGRGLLLLVEKDYMQPSYLRDGDPILYMRPPKGNYTLVPDAVDEIIETVFSKGGQVIFTEDRNLRGFDSIALTLRY